MSAFNWPLKSGVLVVPGYFKPTQRHASRQPSLQKTARNRWHRQFHTRFNTPTSIQHCRQSYKISHGYAKMMAVIPCCGHITWYSIRSSLCTIIFYPLILHTDHCRSSILCTSRNDTSWQIYFSETNHSAPFELISMVILRPSMSTSLNVCISIGRSALSEHDIALTFLVTHRAQCERHLETINYWRYTNFGMSRVMIRSSILYGCWTFHKQ